MDNNFQQESLFNALADIQRRKIINLLKAGEMSVSEIKEHFDISGATLSHHLSLLKKADLVRVTRKGQQRIYTLNMSVAEELLLFVQQLFIGKEDET
jgi:DNA-binding transcriptional ArsR family regulator